MKLIPYLIFDGDGGDAIEFYKNALKVTDTNIMYYSEGEVFDIPAGYEKKIMHAELSFGDNLLYLCDSLPGSTTSYGDGISLHLMIESDEELTTTFDALSQGGQVVQAIKEEFWGAKFGTLNDKYGIHWSLNYSVEQ